MRDYSSQVPHASSDISNAIQTIIHLFLRRMATAEDCRARLAQIIGNTRPFDRVLRIIKISEMNEPLPELTCSESTGKRPSAWTASEDERLLAGIYKYGLNDWTLISNFFGPTRTRAQCSQRWFRGLNPQISTEKWTREQDLALISLVSIYGKKKWTIISQHMANRCDVQCRYRYQLLEKMDTFDAMIEEAKIYKYQQCNTEKRFAPETTNVTPQFVMCSPQLMPVIPPLFMHTYQVYNAPSMCSAPVVKAQLRKPRKNKTIYRARMVDVPQTGEEDCLIDFDESLMGVSCGSEL